MGTASSMQRAPKTLYWTDDEIRENETCMRIQKEAAEFIMEHMYFGVPAKYGKKSVNPTSAIWFEIDPELIENAETDIKKSVLRSVPSGVLCDSKGNIQVFFTLTDVKYELTVEDFRRASKFAAEHDLYCCPTPNPPQLDKRDMNNLWISWKLPLPPGVSFQVEIQFYPSPNSSTSSASSRSAKTWQVLASKSWELPEFSCHHFGGLLAGTGYIFRLRYRTHLGFSDYSEPSEGFYTMPDRPPPPESLSIGATFSDSAHLFWSPPIRDNGVPIEQYVLQGKAAGDSFVELYRGSETSYLVADLHPQAGYTFQVAAINSIGISDFSVAVSVLTLAAKAAITASANNHLRHLAAQCQEAWIEQWDPRGERYFYFNRISGVRQLEKPSVLEDATAQENSKRDEEEVSRKAEVQFRMKRFRFTRLLHKQGPTSVPFASPGTANTNARPGTATTPLTARPSLPATTPMGESSPPRTQRQDLHSVTINREALLGDAFTAIAAAPLTSLKKRLKVSFVGEDGIDSGGLGKEAFLLLSRELIEYAGPKGMKWLQLKTVKSDNGSRQVYVFSDQPEHLTPEIKKSRSRQKDLSSSFLALEQNPQFNELSFAKFLGRLLGKALYDRQLVDIPLSPLLLWHMTGGKTTKQGIENSSNNTSRIKVISKDDVAAMLAILEQVDEDLHKSLKWIVDNNISDVLYETFSVESCQPDGTMKSIALCAGGTDKDVTEENKFEYVYLLAQWKTTFSISHLLTPFLAGFHELVAQETLDECGAISMSELDLMLNGRPIMNVEELRAYCVYQGASSSGSSGESERGNDAPVPFGEGHALIVWLWQLVREMGEAERRELLFFFTGTARVPLDGFDPPLNITEGVDMVEDCLPKAHTCFNQLVLPPYSSYKVMGEKIRYAIKNTAGFGFS